MGSGTFADFLQQMPLGLVRLFFIFFVLIIMSLVGYVLVKRREVRKKNEAAMQPQTPQQPTPPAYTPPSSAQPAPDGDMPDLDTLLAMTEPPPPPAPTAEAPRQPGIVTVQMSTGATVEAAEVLVLARDRATNRLIVQIGEHAYSGAESQIDPAFRRQFVGLMKELSGIAPKLGRGAKAASRKNASPTQATPPLQPHAPAPDPTPAADPTPASGTLAGQIEARLQAKLRATGAFTGRTIHVLDAPDGGVVIEVDGQTYDGVNAVADDEVRAFIAGVVAEWQESLS